MDHGPGPRRMPELAKIDWGALIHAWRNRDPRMTNAVRYAALPVVLLCCWSALAPRPVVAQAPYPSRQIRIVTPLAAGAASDIALRILAEKLSTRFSVPVLVQNEPGSAGVTAARSVTNAPRDGYTILWAGDNN